MSDKPIDDGGPAINDDVFAYTDNNDVPTGMSQCISGFGRNFYEELKDVISADSTDDGVERDELLERIKWNIDELVRWCRHFNGECQKLKARNP